jgi:hypothetical protein
MLSADHCHLLSSRMPYPVVLISFPAEPGEAKRMFSFVSFLVAISLHDHFCSFTTTPLSSERSLLSDRSPGPPSPP